MSGVGDIWHDWTARVGDQCLSGVNRTRARMWLEERLESGVPVSALSAHHKGRPVVIFTATFMGKRHVSLTGPNGQVEYVTPFS